MKKIFLFSVMISGACFLQQCHSPESKSSTGRDSGTEPTMKDESGPEQKTDGQSFETYKSKADDDEAMFIKTAALGGMMEVQAGEYAAKNALNPKIKAFGQKMITDHSKANVELSALAKKYQLIIPSEFPADQKAHMDMMMKMKGADFDKHYMDMMVNDHVKTLALFKSAADVESKDISAFAKKTLPVLQEHYKMAKEIHDAMK